MEWNDTGLPASGVMFPERAEPAVRKPPIKGVSREIGSVPLGVPVGAEEMWGDISRRILDLLNEREGLRTGKVPAQWALPGPPAPLVRAAPIPPALQSEAGEEKEDGKKKKKKKKKGPDKGGQSGTAPSSGAPRPSSAEAEGAGRSADVGGAAAAVRVVPRPSSGGSLGRPAAVAGSSSDPRETWSLVVKREKKKVSPGVEGTAPGDRSDGGRRETALPPR